MLWLAFMVHVAWLSSDSSAGAWAKPKPREVHTCQCDAPSWFGPRHSKNLRANRNEDSRGAPESCIQGYCVSADSTLAASAGEMARHSRMVLSSLDEARRVPSEEKARPDTAPVWPSSEATSRQVVRFQSLTV